MTTRPSMRLLLGWILLGAGCGGSSEDPNCTSAENYDCHPSGLAFVEVAAAVSDTCGGYVAFCGAPNPPAGSTTATLTEPQAGTFCVSGTVGAAGGWAGIVLEFATFNKQFTKVLKTFDADALGITQAAFTVDSPPSAGVTVSASTTASLECPTSAYDCTTQGFFLMTAPLSNIPLTITAPGPQVAPFVNFEQTLPGASQTFDTSALNHIGWGFAEPGDYDFCVQDFKFLDAAGNEVKP